MWHTTFPTIDTRKAPTTLTTNIIRLITNILLSVTFSAFPYSTSMCNEELRFQCRVVSIRRCGCAFLIWEFLRNGTFHCLWNSPAEDKQTHAHSLCNNHGYSTQRNCFFLLMLFVCCTYYLLAVSVSLTQQVLLHFMYENIRRQQNIVRREKRKTPREWMSLQCVSSSSSYSILAVLANVFVRRVLVANVVTWALVAVLLATVLLCHITMIIILRHIVAYYSILLCTCFL